MLSDVYLLGPSGTNGGTKAAPKCPLENAVSSAKDNRLPCLCMKPGVTGGGCGCLAWLALYGKRKRERSRERTKTCGGNFKLWNFPLLLLPSIRPGQKPEATIN